MIPKYPKKCLRSRFDVELGVEGLAGGSGVEWSGVVGRSGQVKKEERAQLTSTDIKLVSVWQ